MRIVISGGGTGGHIYPALAIADEIRRRQPESEILYIGSKTGMEADIVPRAGYRYEGVSISGISRSSPWKALKSLALVPGAMRHAMRIMKDFRPDLVLGTGGYVSYPVLSGAVHMRLQTYIHEQNALPGLANRRLARRVKEVFLTFPEASSYLKGSNSRITGFPVRKEIGHMSRAEARARLGLEPDGFVMLVFGGSQGARRINQAVIEFLYRADCNLDLRIIWACGAGNLKGVQDALQQLKAENSHSRVLLQDYIHEMPAALAAADLALCRAGAGTISELALAGLPAILVPYPFAAENHQAKNAEAVATRNAAIMVPDEELNGARLQYIYEELRQAPGKMKEMGLHMQAEARPGALDEIVDILLAEQMV